MNRSDLGFWNSIGRGQTYLNMLYLLISYPLGLIYFVFIIVGLALGFGLFITWFGIPILVGVMFIWLGFAYFERNLTKVFLGIEIPYRAKEEKVPGIWNTLKSRFSDSYTWKSFVYLLLRFPLGVFGFVVLVTFISLTLGLIASPFVYGFVESGVIPQPACDAGTWCSFMNYPFAILIGLVGILMIFVSLFIFNSLAKAYGLLARAMLSKNSLNVERIKRKVSSRKPVRKKSKKRK